MKSRREFLNETFSTVSGFGVAAAFTALSERISLGGLQKADNKLKPTRDEATGLPLILSLIHI